jgi:FtsZ-binding cell division protein ZapB
LKLKLFPKFNAFQKVTEEGICSTYINLVLQNSSYMVKTAKRSSGTSKKKGKVNSRTRSRSQKVDSRKRKSAKTKRASKVTSRSRAKKRIEVSTNVIIKRTSGRREKFETNKMAQTVSRSGTPFLLARDVAKTVSEKVMDKANNTTTRAEEGKTTITSRPPTVEVEAAEVRKMVAEELKERNRPDIASSYSGERPENTRQGRHELMRENQPLHDADAANQSKLLFDSSTSMAKSTRPSTMKR